LKTGEKYDAKKTAERQRDHSLFIAFAPADKPRIALAIVVENGGFGSAAAAPIVRKALDYYLLGKRPTDKDKTPAEKSDILSVRAESEVRADAESEGGPKPGGVTPGNKD
jgi:penicillin-binding protein 2